jgi:hypothetical protein
MSYLLKAAATALLFTLWWLAVNSLIPWANVPSDVALVVVLLGLLASAVGCVTVFNFIWRREIAKCASFLGL